MAPWVPIAILLCGLCGTVPAQEPPSPGQDDEATDLDAVVVTARKRTESVVEVPMNISVVGASELDNRNAVTVLDIYRTIAGGANPLGQLILRGLVGGNTPTPGTTSQFVDGIPLGFGYITNTPGKSARSQGLEFESTLALTDRTMLTFNYGHTRSRLTADNEVLGAKAGDDMTMVPKYNAYLALDHEFRLLGHQTFARIDVASYGEYKSHFNTRPEDVSPAYTTVNLSGRIRLDDNLQLGVHIENLFNEQYITYRTARSRTSSRSPIHERYGNERGIAVRLDYRF